MFRRRLALPVAVAVLASAALLLVLNPEAARSAGYTVTEAILQARTWTFSQPQTFANGLNISGGDLNINSGGGAAGSIQLEEAAPGTNVGTLTVGDLTAARTYTFPDASGTPALLERAQTWTQPQAFSGLATMNAGLAVSGSSTTVDLGYDYALNTPPGAPTAAQAQTTGGTCSNANTYRFYVSWKNKTGVSAVSPASSPDFTTSSTTSRVTVTRPAAAAEATSWNAWYSSSATGHSQIKGCNVAGGSTDVAIGTTTSECQCRTTGSTFAPTVATTRRVSGWYFNKDYVKRPEINTVEVCNFGCEFSTVSAALAAITTASSTNRYQILMLAPFSSSVTVNAKSYVSFAGDSRTGVSISAVNIPAGVTEVSFNNLTTGTVTLGAANVTDGYVYFNNVNVGSPSSPSGLFSGATEKWNVVATGIVGWTVGGAVLLSDEGSYWEEGAIWFISPPGGNTSAAYKVASHGGHGSRLFVHGSHIEWLNSDATYDAVDHQMILFNNEGGSFGSRDTEILISDTDFNITETSPTRTATTACITFGFEDADAVYQHRVFLRNVDCRIKRTSTSGLIAGINIPDCVAGSTCDTENGHGNWTFAMQGGEISLSGGATRTDVVMVDNAAANLATRLTNVRHAGSYNISGTGAFSVENSSLTTGVVRNTALASPPASCIQGDHYFDTSGGDCTCTVTGTPGTWTNNNGVGNCT